MSPGSTCQRSPTTLAISVNDKSCPFKSSRTSVEWSASYNEMLRRIWIGSYDSKISHRQTEASLGHLHPADAFSQMVLILLSRM
jgi:hypothetical protein